MSEMVQDWLRTKRVMLWGHGGWDLTDDKDVEKAAEWFNGELLAFERFWMTRTLAKTKHFADLIRRGLPAPRPQDHESQLGFNGEPLPFLVNGHCAGGWNEYVIARDWADAQIASDIEGMEQYK